MSSAVPVPPRIRFGAFELDPASGELRKSGILVKLQPQAFRVLLLLIEREGQVVTRDEIQRHLWSDSTFVDFEHAINFSINQIRRALADNAEEPRYVETLTKRGYRFIATLEESPILKLSATSDADPGASHQSKMEVLVYPRRARSESVESPSQPSRRTKSSRWIFAVSTGAAVIVSACVALGVYFWKSNRRALNLEGMHIVRLTEDGNAESVAISPNGQYIVYVLAEGEQRSLNVRQVATGSEVQILPPATVELRGLTFSPDGNYVFFLRTARENFSVDFLYRMPVLGGTPRELIREVDTPISFSPDGKQFAFVRIVDGTNFVVANADGSGERILARRAGVQVYHAAWSPDGKTIAFAGWVWHGDSHLLTVSLADGSVNSIYTTQSTIGRVLWLPDGSGFLAVIRDLAQGQGGQLWYISYPRGETKRVTNDLTDYALDALDLTRDGKSLVTVENTISSNLWVVPGGDAAQAKQITSGRTAVQDVSAGAGQTIVFIQKGDLYSIRSDGSALTLLTPDMHRNQRASACRDGRHIAFESMVDGQSNVWRIDADGSNLIKLTDSGTAGFPLCSQDSQWVQYNDNFKNWRIPIGGGPPIEVDLNGLAAVAMDYSPNGQLIAYDDWGPRGDTPSRIAVIPAVGGEALYRFPLRGDAALERLRWTPDGAGVDYYLTNQGVSNIWRQPVPKGSPHQITSFTSGHIFSFDWSSDGKQLYVARGSTSSSIVQLTNFR